MDRSPATAGICDSTPEWQKKTGLNRKPGSPRLFRYKYTLDEKKRLAPVSKQRGNRCGLRMGKDQDQCNHQRINTE